MIETKVNGIFPSSMLRIFSILLAVATAPLSEAAPVVLIDPGHGGSEVAGSLKERSNSSPNNATTPGGLKEKDLTLEFSLILREEILTEATKQGRNLDVMLTRETDVNPDFISRARLCNRSDTACVVSIHFNATDGAKASGSLAVIAAKNRNPDYDIDKAFALGLVTACSKGVREYLPNSKDMGTIHDSHLHGGLGSNFFFQLQRQPCLKGKPKCFLEIEFIDNAAVERALLGGDRAAKFRTIAGSIARYLVLEAGEPWGGGDEPAKRRPGPAGPGDEPARLRAEPVDPGR
jgi:N-acetylmuramoyl-L-alanine amidase